MSAAYYDAVVISDYFCLSTGRFIILKGPLFIVFFVWLLPAMAFFLFFFLFLREDVRQSACFLIVGGGTGGVEVMFPLEMGRGGLCMISVSW